MAAPGLGNCPICQRPVAPALQGRKNACPFCQRCFGRVDVARRHMWTCEARDGRPLPPKARRGRKLRACDGCSQLKASCNCELPCGRCSSRNIACIYSSVCHDPSHQPTSTNRTRTETPRDDRLTLAFLLRASDPTINSMVSRVAAEPARDSEAPPALKHRSVSATDLAPVSIDPRFFLLDFSNNLMDDFGSFEDMLQGSNEAPIGLNPISASTNTFSGRVNSLVADLDILAVQKPHLKQGYNQSCLNGFFTLAHFENALTAYFRRRHYHATFVHWPTFDPEKMSLHLLLAVMLVGTLYLPYRDDASDSILTVSLLELAETYIFRELKKWNNLRATLASSKEGIEVCQAAIMITSLQGSKHDAEACRRIASKRHPVLVATLRAGGLFAMKHGPLAFQRSWAEFLNQERCIRLATWAFINDAILTLFFNQPPSITLQEMSVQFPCSNELWETGSQNEFEEQRHELQDTSYPSSFSEAVSGLLKEEWTDATAASFGQLGAHNLYMIILDRWSTVWAGVLAEIPTDERKWLGIAEYAAEVAFLSRKVLELSGTEEAGDLAYLRCIAMYDTVGFHQFVRKLADDSAQVHGKGVQGHEGGLV
ncbi:hypothetical protein FZEAL_3349 [Fusarium zealandicum]|uniref:Zn(2)-C6 fungal-type domain-containing protein n=1 Tax=Fusarium zealandicum TaxID=1053134 RepID=A0A8H4XLW0_9HYPO|nr:hypothetical protein FZEAL_3349 [Fusarium zealandicum]